ncbi:hypothetical protein D7D52_22430 [Nocardia yunnanensis]|uniref:DoxX family membrane protein n=1 Tax=Nocardia yunnanensis TaxID=2382165 RepID=A0A386ZFD6_9NOCA|nr:hypothetical protein [Nocardia yunnanensis]AYF76137.1 hypothetical protein D7D52_22430 [Nocardia yunnanensis]
MFITLLLLAVPTVALRVLGVLGVARFATWQVCAAHGLAFMLLMTGAAHFAPASVTAIPNHDDLTAMVPSFIPFPDFTVYATGVLEYLGALGLVLERFRRPAGLALALMFVLLLPANIHAAVDHISFHGDPATPLWFRVPEQLVYIAVALFAALGVASKTRATVAAT